MPIEKSTRHLRGWEDPMYRARQDKSDRDNVIEQC